MRRRKRRSKDLPILPPAVVSRHGKTTVSRYLDRTFYRMEEAKGKTVDFVELFTSTGQHSIQVRFQDETALYFMIEPCFTVDREYGDLRTGNWQTLKQWPRIRSQPNRSI